MNDKITLANYSRTNRTRIIGNSRYTICREQEDAGKWYIYEIYNTPDEFAGKGAYRSDDLAAVIDRLNSFTQEKEIINGDNT